MASPSSSEPFPVQQDRRVVRNASISDIGTLPVDTLYDILLRLSAKELCRLRLVCKSWRSLLSDPGFATAYASRHPQPFLIVGYTNNAPPPSTAGDNRTPKHESVISVLDLSSGSGVVRRVRTAGHVASVSLGLACVKRTGDGSCRLVNPATGAAHRVPKEDPAYGYSDRVCVFGRIPRTREYKVLRMVSYSLRGTSHVLFEVYTVSRTTVVHAQEWRAVQDPPPRQCIDWSEKSSVVIDGVVYFLTKDACSALVPGKDCVFEEDWIVPFDLETERWRPTILGPQVLLFEYNGQDMLSLELVNLNGSLVVVHRVPSTTSMDLWYLLDSDKNLWVKQYSLHIQIEEISLSLESFCPLNIVLEEISLSLESFSPLIVLDDGRIVMSVVAGSEIMVGVYDPRTNKLSSVAETDLSRACAVSVYAGTLLSLEW